MTVSTELQRYKREVDLVAVAKSFGYELVAKKSSPASKHLKNAGHHVIVSQDRDSHLVYKTVAGSSDRAQSPRGKDSGTVIDFLQNQGIGNLGEVRKWLREWTNTPQPNYERTQVEQAAPKDRRDITAQIATSRVVRESSYLQGRGITENTLNSPRFAGVVREVERRVMQFTHYDRSGPAGFERNATTTVGRPGLGFSRIDPQDRKLVVTHSMRDAVRHFQRSGDKHTRYVSVAGQFSEERRQLLQGAIDLMPAGSTIAATSRNDRDGVAWRGFVQEAVERGAERGLKYEQVQIEQVPPNKGALRSERFAGQWKEQVWKNLAFPHQDVDGLCGYEQKNHNFNGFSPGGTKGLAASRCSKADRNVVVVESMIDAMSHYQLHPSSDTRYLSIAGGMNEEQPKLLDKAIARMPEGSKVIAGTDRDADGEKFAEQIREIAAKHPHVSFERAMPAVGKDWNEQLQHKREHHRDKDQEVGR